MKQSKKLEEPQNQMSEEQLLSNLEQYVDDRRSFSGKELKLSLRKDMMTNQKNKLNDQLAMAKSRLTSVIEKKDSYHYKHATEAQRKIFEPQENQEKNVLVAKVEEIKLAIQIDAKKLILKLSSSNGESQVPISGLKYSIKLNWFLESIRFTDNWYPRIAYNKGLLEKLPKEIQKIIKSDLIPTILEINTRLSSSQKHFKTEQSADAQIPSPPNTENSDNKTSNNKSIFRFRESSLAAYLRKLARRPITKKKENEKEKENENEKPWTLTF